MSAAGRERTADLAVGTLFRAATEPSEIRADHFDPNGNPTGYTITTYPPSWKAALAWLERRYWAWAPRRIIRQPGRK